MLLSVFDIGDSSEFHCDKEARHTANSEYKYKIFSNIIKWPMPLGARPRSIKHVNKIL